MLFPVGKSETPTDRAEDLDSPGGATIDNHLEPDPVEQGAVVSWWLFGIGVALAGGAGDRWRSPSSSWTKNPISSSGSRTIPGAQDQEEPPASARCLEKEQGV